MVRRSSGLAAVAMVLSLAGSVLVVTPAAATLPGDTGDLLVVVNQYDPDTGEQSFSGTSRYDHSGTFAGGGASCSEAGAGLTLDPNSRTWFGTSSWGYGTFLACDDGTGDSDIYFFDSAGPSKITNFTGDHYDPAVSPDGSTLAFSSDYEGRRQICLLGVDDNTPDCVTGNNHEGSDWAPVWNPHWDNFAFVSDIDGDADIYQWGPGGDSADWYNYPATDNDVNDFGPDYHPTQMDTILFSTNVSGFDQVFTMNLNDREPQQLTDDSNSNYEAVYSPDGEWIAFVKQAVATPGSYGRTYLMPSSGGSEVALSDQNDSNKEYTHPEWEQSAEDVGCDPDCEPPSEDRWFGSFKLVKPLKTKGQLFSESGDDGCLVGQSVKIQKKVGGRWKTIKSVTTGFEGTFKAALPDKPGTYRGKIKENDVGEAESPWICHGATSNVVKHRH